MVLYRIGPFGTFPEPFRQSRFNIDPYGEEIQFHISYDQDQSAAHVQCIGSARAVQHFYALHDLLRCNVLPMRINADQYRSKLRY